MQQKIIIVGVSRRQGISKKTGNQYDIAMVNTLQPQVGTDTNYVASGFKQIEMQAPSPVVMQFLSMGFPCTVTAELGIRNDGKLEIVSMVAQQNKPVSAAS
jgi:hypothetical protein